MRRRPWGSLDTNTRRHLGEIVVLPPPAIHEGTLCKNYDRVAYLEIKNWLSRNSWVCKEANKKIQVQELGSDQFSMGVQTNWEGANDVHEVFSGGLNFLAAEHMTRQYSYSGIAMIRCLHEVRFFVGVAPNTKVQKGLIEQFFNDCFKVKIELWWDRHQIFIFLEESGQRKGWETTAGAERVHGGCSQSPGIQ